MRDESFAGINIRFVHIAVNNIASPRFSSVGGARFVFVLM